MQRRIWANLSPVVLATAALLAPAACSSDEALPPVSTEPQVVAPTAATVSVVDSALVFDSEARLSPSGAARVGQRNGEWCLEDSEGVRCVAAASEGSRGGLTWRADETAIAVMWGAQDPISIIDFAAGTAVETDLDDHRLLAWTPDGTSLIGLELDRPGEFLRIDPVSLDAESFAPFGDEVAGVPEMRWVNGVLWGSDPFEPAVFTLAGGNEPEVIPGGLGEQQLESISADGRFALAMDDDIDRGRGGPDDHVLHLFDADEQRSNGLQLPPGVEQRDVDAAQLNADATALLLLHRGEGGTTLQRAAIDHSTLTTSGWTEVYVWPQGDPTQPSVFQSGGVLHWNGGSTAYAFTDSDTLVRIDLS